LSHFRQLPVITGDECKVQCGSFDILLESYAKKVKQPCSLKMVLGGYQEKTPVCAQ